MIHLSNAMLDEAARLELKVLANLKKTPNYTGISIKDRFFYGYLGEIIFREYLKSIGVKGVHHINTDGESHRSDITADLNNTATIIDVKAASKPYYKRLMMPLSQELDFNIVVGVKLDLMRSAATIEGFATLDEVLTWNIDVFPPNTIKTRWKFYSELTSIEKLTCAPPPESQCKG